MALNAASAGSRPSRLYSSLTAQEPITPPFHSPSLRSPVGKNQSTAFSGGRDGSRHRTPPWPLMYCLSTGARSLPRRVGTAVPVSYTHLRAHETRHDLV